MAGIDATTIQSLGALLSTSLVAGWLYLKERKKDHDAPVQKGGEAQIVAASFVEKRQMDDLIFAIRANTAALGEILGPIEKIQERLHEEELVRAATARIREGRG